MQSSQSVNIMKNLWKDSWNLKKRHPDQNKTVVHGTECIILNESGISDKKTRESERK